MADVPTYDSPRVAPQVSQPGHLAGISTDVFGESIGHAISNIGGAIGDYARRENRFADEMKANDVAAQAMDWKQQALLHPQNGLLNQGFNDTDKLQSASDKILSSFSEQSSKWMDGLQNDRQREMAQRHINAIHSSLEGAIYGYEKQQGDRIVVSKTSNQLKILQQDAANFYNDLAPPGDETPPHVDPDNPEATVAPAVIAATKDMVTSSLERQHQLINDAAQHLGWTNEQRDEAIAQSDSKTHVNVINSMLTNAASGKMDADKISAYFDKNQEAIFPQERKSLAAAIEGASLNQNAGAISSEILYDKKTHQLRPIADINEDLASNPRLMKNDRLAEKVDGQIGRTLRLHKAAVDETHTNTYNSLWNSLPDIGGDMTRIPTQVLQSLPPHMQEQLYKQASQIQNGRLPPSGTDVYYSLRKAAANPDETMPITEPIFPGSKMTKTTMVSFKDLDLSRYRADMSAGNYETMIDEQTKQVGKATPGAGINVGSSTEQLVKSALFNAGIVDPPIFDKNGSPNPDAVPAVEFRRLVDEGIAVDGGEHKIGTSGVMKVIKNITADTLIRKAGQPDQHVMKFQLIPKGGVLSVNSIPDSDRQEIIREAGRRGITLTPEQQVQWYNDRLMLPAKTEEKKPASSSVYDVMFSTPGF